MLYWGWQCGDSASDKEESKPKLVRRDKEKQLPTNKGNNSSRRYIYYKYFCTKSWSSLFRKADTKTHKKLRYSNSRGLNSQLSYLHEASMVKKIWQRNFRVKLYHRPTGFNSYLQKTCHPTGRNYSFPEKNRVPRTEWMKWEYTVPDPRVSPGRPNKKAYSCKHQILVCNVLYTLRFLENRN